MDMKYLAFFPSWVPLLYMLPENRILPFIEGIIDYATKGIEPEYHSEIERSIFASIRINVDGSVKHYNSRCEQNRRNGKLGGLAKSQNRRARIAAEMEGYAANVV